MNQTATDIISSVILAGEAVGASRGGSTGNGSGAGTPTTARVIDTADNYLGVPYKWGGSSPITGFDCSGYVKYVFARQGVQLPRTSREQSAAGRAVTASVSSLRQGDIVLFAESRQQISHVAIYAGEGMIIHSSSSGGGVRYDDLNTQRGRWFVTHMVKARRLVANGRSLVQSLKLISIPGLPFDAPDKAPKPAR